MRAAAGITVLGLALVAVAAVFDVAPLYVPGIGLVAMAALAGAWVAGATRGVRVRRELGADRVVEGEPLPVRLVVAGGAVPLPIATVRDPLLGAPLRLRAGTRAQVLEAVARLPRRGRVRVAAPTMTVRDPLELVRRTVAGAPGGTLVVLPRIAPVEPADGATGVPASAAGAAAAMEVDGIRPYREGTPASRIHWPALARGRGLMERRLRAADERRPQILLDPRDPASRDALDAAVRAAASLAHRLARDGGVTLLLPGDRPRTIGPDLAAWPAAHVRLALIESGAGALPLGAIAGSAPLLFVVARQVERPPRAVAAAAGDVTLVVPGTLPGRTAVLAVAGCHGYAAAGRSGGPGPVAAAGGSAP